MKNRVLFSLFALPVLFVLTVSAQRPDTAPATMSSGKPPDTVFIEELTWAEVRDLVAAGTTSVIVGTAGTEQKGPHMVDGEHKFVMTWSADKVARALGKTLVAPIVTYVPEGSWENPGGHMGKPGTITLPEDRFVELLVMTGRSLKAGGFKKILFLGESGGNRTGMRAAAEKLNALWQGAATAYWVDDYYTKAHAQQNTWAAKYLKVADDQVGNHANILDTSELLFVAPKHIRRDRLTGNDYPNNGVSGNNQSKSTPEVGKALLQIKVDLALAQVKRMLDGSEPPVAAPQAPRGGGGRGGPQNAPAGPPQPTMVTAPAGLTPTKAPDTVFIDELTWEENRDAMKAGKTVFIVPTGGTEKNGYHMVMGKHNYTVTHAANVMARRLKNALVAPVIQYVPEGDPDRQNAGAISLPSPAYDLLLDAAARSLKAHGATDILFIGDSGGNQAGMTAVANKLNEEWKGGTTKVYALTAYYEDGRVHYRAWMQAAFGYDDEMIGSHAGISDTAQMLHVNPAGVRKNMLMAWGGPKDSGVSGDPMKATAEIGRMGIEFKVNAAIAQYKLLKNPPQPRGRGGNPRGY
ncbi:MAG: creatininase family protein [Vicinamibacterales bacterium]|jgi:creatinine amidohydrolase/Fe(II)-dependent formamide hydrolase-like protein